MKINHRSAYTCVFASPPRKLGPMVVLQRYDAPTRSGLSSRLMTLCLALLLPALGPPAIAAGDDPAGVAFFERKIRPLLVERCYECHSQAAKQVQGGLLLDSRGGILRGGDSGPVIVAGQPSESLLLEAIGYAGDIQMQIGRASCRGRV